MRRRRLRTLDQRSASAFSRAQAGVGQYRDERGVAQGELAADRAFDCLGRLRPDGARDLPRLATASTGL